MSYITWDDKIYSVGIVKMDEQHKKLVGLINALHAKRESPDREFVLNVFATLVHYARAHFVDEEKILKRLRFTGFEQHHAQHVQFIHAVDKFKVQFESQGPSPGLIDSLTHWLAEWLQHHILVEDKAYGRFLES